MGSKSDFEKQKNKEMKEYGCGAIPVAGKGGSTMVSAVAVKAEFKKKTFDMCFATNKVGCNGENSFALGLGPGSTDFLIEKIPKIGIFLAAISDTSIAIGFSAGGHYSKRV